ncbi:MAG: Na-translocating system protein MpsC family protein [Bacillota bacterium]
MGTVLQGAVTRMLRELYGKGPERVDCEALQQTVIITCRGILTPVERSLIEGPGGKLTVATIRDAVRIRENELLKEYLEQKDLKLKGIFRSVGDNPDETRYILALE